MPKRVYIEARVCHLAEMFLLSVSAHLILVARKLMAF